LSVSILRHRYCREEERVENGGNVDFLQHRGSSRIRGVFGYIGRMHKGITATGLEGAWMGVGRQRQEGINSCDIWHKLCV
jgi:hypothetical protein